LKERKKKKGGRGKDGIQEGKRYDWTYRRLRRLLSSVNAEEIPSKEVKGISENNERRNVNLERIGRGRWIGSPG